MIKNILLGFVLLIISAFGFAQDKNFLTLNSNIRNTFLYQTLHEFDQNVPLIISGPGFFMYGNINQNNQNYFFRDDYYDDATKMRSSYLQEKELAELTNPCFLPYIPKDSNTLIRALYKDRLLFEITIKPEPGQLAYSQVSGDKKLSKEISLKDGIPVLSVSTDNGKVTRSEMLVKNDTLTSFEFYNAILDEYSKEDCFYNSGLLYKKDHYIYHPGGRPKLYATTYYTYDDNKNLSSEQSYNRKGKIKDSTAYSWQNRQLVSLGHFRNSSQDLSITYQYDANGKLVRKAITTPGKKASFDYSSFTGSRHGFIFRDNSNDLVSNTQYELNTEGKLAVIELSRYRNEISDQNFLEYNKFIFGYNPDGNIHNIKKVDQNGKITKELTFEYSFFPASRK